MHAGTSEPAPPQKLVAFSAPARTTSTHVVGVSGAYPSQTADRGYTGFWTSLQAGADLPAVVPHSRWDLEQYYAPEARGDLTMYARHAACVDDLDMFDASLFR